MLHRLVRIKRPYGNGYIYVNPDDVSAVIDDADEKSIILLKNGKELRTDEPGNVVTMMVSASNYPKD